MNNAINKVMTQEEFENVCKNKGITNTFEIYKRWCNYRMFLSNGHFDRSAVEVGANIVGEDKEEIPLSVKGDESFYNLSDKVIVINRK